MGYMFEGAAAFNQPLSFDTAAVTNVSAYACFESDDSNEKPDSDFLFPTLQMEFMFAYATAFNQPLPFNTSAVTNVSTYACFESDDSNEKPDSDFLSPTGI